MVRLLHLRLACAVISHSYRRATILRLHASLSTFAVGFVLRPRRVLFWRSATIVGRKYAFLVTLLIMGVATALIGFLRLMRPSDRRPLLLLLIRLLQGFALGGDMAARRWYVAEARAGQKARFYTSHSNHCNLGLFVSLPSSRRAEHDERCAFAAVGLALPFIISIFLFGVSLYIR